MLEQYQKALKIGDIREALRIARLIDWVAVAPKITPKAPDQSAYENALRISSMERRAESAILKRNERLTIDF
jgi:hypothetical protein